VDFGVEDDFFSLGGSSLTAIRMMASLSRRFGVNLSAANLFQARTVRSLSALVRNQPARKVAALAPFRTQGHKPPLFCVHPAWGEVLCYAKLASFLGDDQPFFALQDPSLFDDSAVAGSVEEMAARYLAEIREVAPHGPYRLAGYSFGGIVAFEMAKQLEAQGGSVELLAILDTPAPDYHAAFAAQVTPAILLESLMAQLGISQSRTDGVEISSAEQVDRIMAEVKTRTGFEDEAGQGRIARLWRGFTSRFEIEKFYDPGPCDAQVTLFRTSEANPHLNRTLADWHERMRSEPDLGWSRYSRRPPRVIAAPGWHDVLMDEPYVKSVAEELRQTLAKF
jgi:thioesterase domain-containing protein